MKKLINKVVNEYNKNSNVKANKNKIYYSRGYGFYTKSNKKFKNIETKEEVNKAKLKKDMSSKVKSNNTNKNRLKTIKKQKINGTIQTYATTRATTRKYDVSQLSSTIFYTTDQFSGQENCAPTAGTTLLMYWAYNRSVRNIWNDTPTKMYNELRTIMKHSNSAGTSSNNFYAGITNFPQNRGAPPIGSGKVYHSSITFSKAESYISSNIPFAMELDYDNKYGYHMVVCFGTETNGSYQSYRIADGWTSSHQVWYNFSNNIDGYYYVRW